MNDQHVFQNNNYIFSEINHYTSNFINIILNFI